MEASMSIPFSKENLPTDLFINNEFVPSKNSRKLSLFNPKDGTLVSDQVAIAGEEDVEAAVAGAEEALPAWKEMTAAKRRAIMVKFADLIEEHTELLAELTRITLGAPYLTWGKHEIGVAIEVKALYLCRI